MLADVTEDLEAQRNAVKAALAPEHVIMAPEGDYVGLTAAEFDKTIEADLKQADLFVQLLSPTAGRIQRGFALPLPQLQFERARAANIPIMQWCRQSPQSLQIDDTGHQRLFETEFLQVTNLATFSENIVKALKERQEKLHPKHAVSIEPPTVKRKLVFVDDLAGEQTISGRLRAIIKNQDCDIRSAPPAIPLGAGGIDIKEVLKPCRGGITIFTDRNKLATVYSRLMFFLNQIAEANLALTRWGVYIDEGGTVASEFGIDSEDVIAVSEQGLPDFLRGL